MPTQRRYPKLKVTPRTKDLPATLGALDLVRTEMKHEFRSLEFKVSEHMERIDAKLTDMRIMMEEQNARNQIVLEGLSNLWQKTETIDKRVTDVEVTVRSLKPLTQPRSQ